MPFFFGLSVKRCSDHRGHHRSNGVYFVFIYEVPHARVKTHRDICLHPRKHVRRLLHARSRNVKVDVTTAEEDGSSVVRSGIIPWRIIGADQIRFVAGRLQWFHDAVVTHRVSLTWIGALGLLGIAASVRQRAGLALAAALALSLGSSFGIGDAVPRYVYSVEWMLYVFPLLGAAAIADAVRFFKMRRTQ